MSVQTGAGKWMWYLAAGTGTFIMATLGVFVRHVTPGNEFAIALGRFTVGFVCLAGLQMLIRRQTHDSHLDPPIRLTWGLAGSGIFWRCLSRVISKRCKAAP